MPKIPSLTGKKPAPRAPEQKLAAPVTWMRVLEDKQVPRAGGTYMLRGGKEIPSSSYNFELLKRAGVKLESCDPPQWFQDAQLAAIQRREELEEAGAENLPEAYDPTAPNAQA